MRPKEGKLVRDTEVFGKMSPYLTITFKGKKFKTKVHDSGGKKPVWKDEFVLLILSAPIVVLAWAVISDDPEAMDKVKLFFEYFSTLPSWFTNLWILVVASIFGIKGTQIFRNGGKK